MDNQTRISHYTKVLTASVTVDGFYRLTPKQRRRAEHKFRRASKHLDVTQRDVAQWQRA